MTTARVLAQIATERARQDVKWGEQNHADGTGRPSDAAMADLDRAKCKANGPGEDSWRDILQEEVSEAFAETDPTALRGELVQVAATAVSWIEAIDRRTTPTPVDTQAEHPDDQDLGYAHPIYPGNLEADLAAAMAAERASTGPWVAKSMARLTHGAITIEPGFGPGLDSLLPAGTYLRVTPVEAELHSLYAMLRADASELRHWGELYAQLQAERDQLLAQVAEPVRDSAALIASLRDANNRLIEQRDRAVRTRDARADSFGDLKAHRDAVMVDRDELAGAVARLEAQLVEIAAGHKTINERRAADGLPPWPGAPTGETVWTPPTPDTRCTCNPEGPRRDDRFPSASIQMIDHLCPWHGEVALARYRTRRADLERQRRAEADR